jgi:TraM recognition site of TraD and TraG
MLAPILVAPVSSVLDAAIEKSRRLREPLDPLLRLLLDGTANCAPLQTLPGHLSDVAAYGVRIATVWQSIAQMRERYGDAKDAIIGASTDKVFPGPITDKTTRDEVVELLGQQTVEVDDHSTLGPKSNRSGSPAALVGTLASGVGFTAAGVGPVRAASTEVLVGHAGRPVEAADGVSAFDSRKADDGPSAPRARTTNSACRT